MDYCLFANIDEFVIINHRPVHKQRENKQVRVIRRPNVSLDWGAYQQYLALNEWQNADYVFFMHDDVDIINSDVFEECIKIIETTNCPAVGHSKVCGGREVWSRSYYVQSPVVTIRHKCLRGSFFCLPRKTLEAIDGTFELHPGSQLQFGNHSMVSTCGKIAERAGRDFRYLSDDLLSPWMEEYYRGKSKRD